MEGEGVLEKYVFLEISGAISLWLRPPFWSYVTLVVFGSEKGALISRCKKAHRERQKFYTKAIVGLHYSARTESE